MQGPRVAYYIGADMLSSGKSTVPMAVTVTFLLPMSSL
jgi:hypothetical protein